MKTILISAKESGNTFKMCSYVSCHSKLECKAIGQVDTVDLSEYDTIVLLSGVYGGKVHRNVQSWIENLDVKILHPNVKFYCFLTWLGRANSDRDAFNELGKLLNQKGIQLEDNYSSSYARSFFFFKRSHPNEEEYHNIVNWVNNLSNRQ